MKHKIILGSGHPSRVYLLHFDLTTYRLCWPYRKFIALFKSANLFLSAINNFYPWQSPKIFMARDPGINPNRSVTKSLYIYQNILCHILQGALLKVLLYRMTCNHDNDDNKVEHHINWRKILTGQQYLFSIFY